MADTYTVVPLSPIRKLIAARMAEAKRTIPHFRVGVDIQVDALDAVRRDLNAGAASEKLSLNDLLIKACALALREVPAVNVQWADNEIHQYATADISVVMALKDGLSTPIVRNADSKSVREISREVKELAALVVANRLTMEQVFGGTFSISNLGMYGVDEFDAIINPPQCAMLAVGRSRPYAIVSPEGQAGVGSVMRLTLSVDHRALDGVTAARFLAALRHILEHPQRTF